MKTMLGAIGLLLLSIYAFAIPECIDVGIMYYIMGAAAAVGLIVGLFTND